MNLGTPVLDLSSVLAALSSFGGVSGALTVLRQLFLDKLIGGLDSSQQNIVLRGVNVLLNFAAILGLSVFAFHMPLSGDLLTSTAVVVIGLAAPASHYLFVSTKAHTTNALNAPAGGSYPVYPPDGTDASAPSVVSANAVNTAPPSTVSVDPPSAVNTVAS